MAAEAAAAICFRVTAGLTVEAMKSLMKNLQMVVRCKKECMQLDSLLKAMYPDVEDMEKVVDDLRKIDPNTEEINMRIVEKWLQELRQLLTLAGVAVHDCSIANSMFGAFTRYRLSKRITAHIKNIEKLQKGMPELDVSLQTLLVSLQMLLHSKLEAKKSPTILMVIALFLVHYFVSH